MALWGNVNNPTYLPTYLNEKERQRCYLGPRGWMYVHENGTEELLIAVPTDTTEFAPSIVDARPLFDYTGPGVRQVYVLSYNEKIYYNAATEVPISLEAKWDDNNGNVGTITFEADADYSDLKIFYLESVSGNTFYSANDATVNITTESLVLEPLDIGAYSELDVGANPEISEFVRNSRSTYIMPAPITVTGVTADNENPGPLDTLTITVTLSSGVYRDENAKDFDPAPSLPCLIEREGTSVPFEPVLTGFTQGDSVLTYVGTLNGQVGDIIYVNPLQPFLFGNNGDTFDARFQQKFTDSDIIKYLNVKAFPGWNSSIQTMHTVPGPVEIPSSMTDSANIIAQIL